MLKIFNLLYIFTFYFNSRMVYYWNFDIAQAVHYVILFIQNFKNFHSSKPNRNLILLQSLLNFENELTNY
jgi:hypothetical protein